MVLQCNNGVGSNLTALKSNSNTVWFNFQTYIYIYIYIYVYIYIMLLNRNVLFYNNKAGIRYRLSLDGKCAEFIEIL